MSIDEHPLAEARRRAGLEQLHRDITDTRGEWDYPDDGNAIRGIGIALIITAIGLAAGYIAYRLGIIESTIEASIVALIIGGCMLYGTRHT